MEIIDALAKQTRDRGNVPAEKAQRKAQDTVGGIVLLAMGCVFNLLGVGLLAVPMLVIGEQPGVWLIGAAVLLILAGMYLISAGSHVMSGETIAAAERSGGFFSVLAKLLRLIPNLLKRGE